MSAEFDILIGEVVLFGQLSGYFFLAQGTLLGAHEPNQPF